jgi:hypothetical protein
MTEEQAKVATDLLKQLRDVRYLRESITSLRFDEPGDVVSQDDLNITFNLLKQIHARVMTTARINALLDGLAAEYDMQIAGFEATLRSL